MNRTKVSIVKLHEETKALTFNQIAIESMRKLVLTILKNESKGLKDFFEANVPLEKGLTSQRPYAMLKAPVPSITVVKQH
jgi:hypothetical protein